MRPRSNQDKTRSKVINDTVNAEWRESIMFHSRVWKKINKSNGNDLCYITAALNHGNRAAAVTDPV